MERQKGDRTKDSRHSGNWISASRPKEDSVGIWACFQRYSSCSFVHFLLLSRVLTGQCRAYYRDGHILYAFFHHQQCWECRRSAAPMGTWSPPGRIRTRSVVGTGMYDSTEWRGEGLPGGRISSTKAAGYSDLCRPGRSARIHRCVSYIFFPNSGYLQDQPKDASCSYPIWSWHPEKRRLNGKSEALQLQWSAS